MAQEDVSLFGLIADEELCTGLLLASIGQTDYETGQTNYYVVNPKTEFKLLKAYFLKLYARKNIAILLLSSDVIERLGSLLQLAKKMLPIIVEIPTRAVLYQRALHEEKAQRLSELVI